MTIRNITIGGYRDLVDLMIEKGANNWNECLYGACKRGHRDLVDLMIEKGANNWSWSLGVLEELVKEVTEI